ncbi:hypothetical protein LguiA_016364 [Lonicera macranthoides]
MFSNSWQTEAIFFYSYHLYSVSPGTSHIHKFMLLQSPCEHAFCLDCARSDSLCYLCDERIQKIQTIKLMEGIFICAAPHCLKSFLKKTEFESHIHSTHPDLLGHNTKKDVTEAEVRKPTASDSTVQAPLRAVLSPSSNSQIHDREDYKSHRREQPPTRVVIQPKSTPALYGQSQNHVDPQPGNNRAQSFDGPSPQNRFPQQSFDTQPPNYAVPVNSNFALAPPPFGYPPFAPNGPQPFYSSPFEMMRPESAPEGGSEQGSVLGFPPGPAGGMNFSENYPRGPWNIGPNGMHSESAPPMVQTDSQGGVALFQGDYGRNQGVLPSPNSGNPMDPKGILAPQPFPPPPPPPHLAHVKRGNFYPGDMAAHDGQGGFGWQHEKRDSFGSGQD